MRRVYKIFILSILLVTLNINAFAYEKKEYEETNGILIMNYEVKQSEEQLFLNEIEKNIEINGKKYEYVKYEKSEDEANYKAVSETILKEDLAYNDKERIKAITEASYEYKADGYTGVLDISDIDIETKHNGTYEEIESLDIPFQNLNSNDLYNIQKEIGVGAKIYSLINVEWENEKIEKIDGSIIPVLYKGVLHYQTVIEKEKNDSYDATINYSGVVKADDGLYQYKVIYKEIIPEPVQESNYIIPVVIVSAVGIVLVMVLIISQKRKK